MWASVLWEDVIHPSRFAALIEGSHKPEAGGRSPSGRFWLLQLPPPLNVTSCYVVTKVEPDVYLQFAYHGAHPLHLTGSYQCYESLNVDLTKISVTEHVK